jgi:hypothetical protein
MVSYRGDTSDLATNELLRKFLRSWPSIVDGGEANHQSFVDAVDVDRLDSDSSPFQTPCWRAFLYLSTSHFGDMPPRGPFYDPKTQSFAESAADAASRWLRDDNYRQRSSPEPSLRILVSDPRARIKELARNSKSMEIFVDGTKPDMALTAVVQLTGFDGTRSEPINAPVLQRDGVRVAVVAAESPFQSVRTLLFGHDGFVYDESNESIARRSSRGYSLFGVQASHVDSDLTHILANGESDTVECKAWMPTDSSDPKAIELLQTVCAFANGQGGTIWIGINDKMEVDGTARHLRKWGVSRKVSAISLEDMRAEYSRTVRARIADGISPSVAIEIVWIEFGGGEHVCRIKVGGTNRVQHHLITNNDIFVRRGASSRKARPDEIADVTRSGLLR